MLFELIGDNMTFEELKARITAYTEELQEAEKAPATIRAYKADINGFFVWAGEEKDGDPVTRSDVIAYKAVLKSSGAETSTINRKIVSLNKFLRWAGADEATGTKQFKQQDRATLEDVITYEEYLRLISAAEHPGEQARRAGMKPDLQMWALIQTIGGTGIRFNELQYFTVEALKVTKKTGKITVVNKGKERSIPVNASLIKLLTNYCKDTGIETGIIFRTRNGTPLRNEQVSKRLKRIAGYARISKSKVHPHNFRHLFAKRYMENVGRLDELQSILGHSSIATTTIYTKSTAKELAGHTETLGMIPAKTGRRRRA